MGLMMARRRAEELKKKKAEPKAQKKTEAEKDGTDERTAKQDRIPTRVRR